MYEYTKVFEELNADDSGDRLSALGKLLELERRGIMPAPRVSDSVNNHIHTIYSFSPYSPAKAVFMARAAGLSTAGIMDHDSVGGCEEFVQAGELAHMAVTCGFECRVRMDSTPFAGRRLNNPDQISVAYVALHGIPHQNFGLCEQFLEPRREKRNIRNRAMTARLNEVIAPLGISLDFERDIAPLSQSARGGSVTERHILFALSGKMTERFPKGPEIVKALTDTLGIGLSPKVKANLSDAKNPYYEYDLLGAMKSSLVSAFYIDATEECPDFSEFVEFGRRCGGVTAYAYLGDVGDSVTGDKRSQKFEDDCLDELFAYLKASGFNAVTYMPSRNTSAQLDRVIALCQKFGLFEISGEDINTPRQSFICEAMKRPEFRHLTSATWALIGHETAATRDLEDAMFAPRAVQKYPSLPERVAHYAQIGRRD